MVILGLLNIHPRSTAASEPVTERYDIAVIGSELQGVLLAKAAQAYGLKVIVLDPRKNPGGELVQGRMFVLDDVNDNSKNSLVQGEIKKLFDGYKSGSIRKTSDFISYYNDQLKGIPIMSGIKQLTPEVGAKDKLKTVTTLSYKDKNGKNHRIASNYWVENTDFAALAGQLGVERIKGMESINGKTKPDYMAATYMLSFKKVDWSALHASILKDYPLTNVRKKYGPNTYVDWNIGTGFSSITANYDPKDSQLRLRGLNMTYQKDGQVIINGLLIYDVDPSDPASINAAMSKGRAQEQPILHFLRKNIPGFSKAELNESPPYLYIRDYNRFKTKYILTDKDLFHGTMFWDNVSIGGYPVDLQGTKAIPMGIGFGKPDKYGLPLRSFELDGYDNVILAGKNVGATIKAYGSARIMPTNALAAQTIGIILGIERTKKLTDLTPEDFVRIHAYLKKKHHISLQ